jgi:GAF domain-containing protein
VAGEAIELRAAVDDRAGRYRELLPQVRALVEGEPDLIANLANITAALRVAIPVASWVGFYLRRGDELVLGPFQGKVACVRIAIGRGVCGTAAAERRTVVVPDVSAFAGHIACDAGAVVGVLDLDSYQPSAFDDIDAAHLGELAAVVAALRW